ncbi:MAG TPA: hypothetical protein VGQ09_23440 [Chitinophagaceae bacterium]|nr:hypothetical protein [Chitinophagaceae bacterium]
MSNKQFFSGGITYEELKMLNDNFKKSKRYVLRKHSGKEETNAIWFERDDAFMDFFAKVLANPTITGVRIYLCEYADKPQDGIPKDDRYLKQLTVALVPTILGKGRQDDLPVVSTEAEKFILAAGALNNGQLCPPDTGCYNESSQ